MNAPAPQDRPSPPPRAPSAATGRALTFLTGLSLAALTLALTAREVVQIDPWFHIAAGRWILEHLAIPRTNVFLEAHPEHAFVDLEWLFQVGAALGCRLGGVPLLSLAKLALVGLAVALVASLSRREPGLGIGLATLFAGAAFPRFILRPEVVSLTLFATQLLILERATSGPRSRYRSLDGRSLAALALLQWLWSNCHGLSLLGPLATGCYVLEALAPASLQRTLGLRRRVGPAKPLLAALGLQLLAASLTPFGPAGLLWPFRKAAAGAVESERIVELAATFGTGAAWTLDTTVFVLALTLTVLAAVDTLRRGRGRLARLCLAAGPILLGLRFARLIPFAMLGLLPLLAGALDDRGPGLRARVARLRAAALALILLAQLGLLGLSLEGGIHRTGLFEARLGLGASEVFRFKDAVEFWRAQPPQGRIFNSFSAGHHLIFAGRTDPKPWICGNADLYPTAFLAQYWALIDGRADLAAYADEQGMTDILLDHRTGPAPVLRLARSADWVPVFLSHRCVIFRRRPRDPDAPAPVRADLSRVDAPDSPGLPYPRVHLAHALGLLGGDLALTRGLALIEDVRRAHPEWLPALFVHARLAVEAGKRDLAAGLYRDLVRRRPGDLTVRVAAGNAALVAGAAKEARQHFEAALAQVPAQESDPARRGLGTAAGRGLAQALLDLQDLVNLRRLLASGRLAPEWTAFFGARAAARESDFPRAIKLYGEALEARPGLVEARYYLGELRYQRKDWEPAAAAFAAVVARAPRDLGAWDYLGGSLYAAGDFRAAADAWRRALELRPDRLLTRSNRARALLQAGEPEAAIAEARTVLQQLGEANTEPAQRLRRDLRTLIGAAGRELRKRQDTGER